MPRGGSFPVGSTWQPFEDADLWGFWESRLSRSGNSRILMGRETRDERRWRWTGLDWDPEKMVEEEVAWHGLRVTSEERNLAGAFHWLLQLSSKHVHHEP